MASTLGATAPNEILPNMVVWHLREEKPAWPCLVKSKVSPVVDDWYICKFAPNMSGSIYVRRACLVEYTANMHHLTGLNDISVHESVSTACVIANDFIRGEDGLQSQKAALKSFEKLFKATAVKKEPQHADDSEGKTPMTKRSRSIGEYEISEARAHLGDCARALEEQKKKVAQLKDAHDKAKNEFERCTASVKKAEDCRSEASVALQEKVKALKREEAELKARNMRHLAADALLREAESSAFIASPPTHIDNGAENGYFHKPTESVSHTRLVTPLKRVNRKVVVSGELPPNNVYALAVPQLGRKMLRFPGSTDSMSLARALKSDLIEFHSTSSIQYPLVSGVEICPYDLIKSSISLGGLEAVLRAQGLGCLFERAKVMGLGSSRKSSIKLFYIKWLLPYEYELVFGEPLPKGKAKELMGDARIMSKAA